MRRRTAGAALICSGILLIVAALVLTLYNFWDDDRAEAASRDVLSVLQEYIEEQRRLAAETGGDDPAVNIIPDYILDPKIEMPTVEIEGYAYLGTIHFPSLDLTLPVMADWDYDRIAIAPCRYTGSVYTKDLILCGHNYTAHFGRLRNLFIGAHVEFTDVEGNVFRYKVDEIEVLPGTAVEEMKSGEWDLTLFTCTLSGQTRTTVRCTAID